ncbi:GLPGLI family protein [Chryseobacterium gregarium]|uniref:GLPGLI family protein n=1 Tax=Chryseobacterium gregarium TaxID=456299 RepID=UPI0003FEEC03|nr:GLPGLI family protein [Chryseobacterium gregarium]
MLKTVFFFIFSIFLIKAQNKRFVYEYRFAQDSAHLENQSKELLNLDIGREGSAFYASEILEQDSLVKIKERPAGQYPYQGIKFLDVIIKKYPDFEMNFYTSCLTYYQVSLSKKLEWKVLPEKERILGYSAQKATTTLYKRKWTVWFTTNIPVQDGPYLFQGLPGLIIKAEDESKSTSFTLAGIKSLAHFNISEIPYYFRLNTVKIGENDLKKVLKNYFDKPTPQRNNEYGDVKQVFYDGNGKEISSSEFNRMVEQNNKNALKKSNNLLRWDIIK